MVTVTYKTIIAVFRFVITGDKLQLEYCILHGT